MNIRTVNKNPTVKMENGFVLIFNPNGSFRRYVCCNAISAEVKKGNIHVTMRDGSVKQYSIEGDPVTGGMKG